MKKLIIFFSFVILLFMQTGCTNGRNLNRFEMIAQVQNIGEKIEVNVIESQYTNGIHLVITSSTTKISNSSGLLNKEGLNNGDVVKIVYNGQVMMSYPPQIVALEIIVL